MNRFPTINVLYRQVLHKTTNIITTTNGACTSFSRNLILQTSSSPGPVRVEKLTDSDYGIVELKLEREKAKNAIGREMLNGLRHAMEGIERDSSANVVFVSSSVPGVCAGADIKIADLRSLSCTTEEKIDGSLAFSGSSDPCREEDDGLLDPEHPFNT